MMIVLLLFLQKQNLKGWVRKTMDGVRRAMGKKFFRDWKDLNDNWGKAVERNVGRKVEMDRTTE